MRAVFHEEEAMNTTNTCIIFDMDGTLWDASDNIAAAYNALLHEQRGCPSSWMR